MFETCAAGRSIALLSSDPPSRTPPTAESQAPHPLAARFLTAQSAMRWKCQRPQESCDCGSSESANSARRLELRARAKNLRQHLFGTAWHSEVVVDLRIFVPGDISPRADADHRHIQLAAHVQSLVALPYRHVQI